jgi:RHS repeat-associated protein
VFGEVSRLRVNADDLPAGPLYEFVLDSLGRAGTTKRDGVVIGTATYDGPRLLTRTDAAGHTTTYTYGAAPLRNLATITTGGTTTELRYDAMGRVVKTVTAGMESDSVGYDLLNRVTYGRDLEGGVTRASYAGNGVDLGELIDPLNQRYGWVRNALGLVTQETDPAGLSTGYVYYRTTGMLKTRTNRRGQPVGFTYDAEGRLRTRTADGAVTTWSYDPDRRWRAVETPVSRDTVRYDTEGKLAESVTWRDGRRYAIRRTYTDRNQPDSVVVAGPWGTRGYVYTQDRYGRLDGLRDYAGKWTRMYLNAEGLPDSVRLPTAANMRLSFAFTDRHQLLSTDVRGAGALSHRYDYTGRGLLTTDTVGSAPTWHGNHYGYDPLDRIGSWDYNQYTRELSCPVGRQCQFVIREHTLQQQAFTWDSVGNPRGAPLDAGNRLRGYGGYSMNYDADGNLIRKYNASGFDQTFTWNSLGQLTGAARAGAGSVTYAYDGFGRRAKRTDAGTGAAIHYIYDGDDLALEVDGAGNLLREYTYYPGIDRPHGMRQWAGGAGGASYYYVLQQPGHVNGLVNLNDQLVNEYRYSPFGTPVSGYPVQGTTNPLQYMARELDATTGMYYVRNRWYDPQQGRFISEDPIGLAGGINQYAYADNAPTMKLDPMGLTSCSIWSPVVTMWDVTARFFVITCTGVASHNQYMAQSMMPPTFRTAGSGEAPFGRGGGAPTPREPDEPKIDTCLVKGALAVANLAADAVGVGLLMDAGAAFLRYAPKLGKGFAFDMVAGNIGHAFVWGGLAPVSLNVGGATVTADGNFNGMDLALFVGGFVPVIGSGIAVGDALVTCANAIL